MHSGSSQNDKTGYVVKLLAPAFLTLACAWAQPELDPPQQKGQSSRNTRSGNMENEVKITSRGNYRYITSNGIPDHKTGRFPNRNNPNSISEQNHSYRVPLKPKKARVMTRVSLSVFGVAVNGVPFDPGAAEFWQNNRTSGWQYEALSGKINLGMDSSNAHVQPGGKYHYHGFPMGLVKKLGGENRMPLIGYAADGFPIYTPWAYDDPRDAKSKLRVMRPSFKVKKGTRSGGPGEKYDGTFVQDYEYVKGSGDLDQCNGRFGVTPEYPDGTYHYFITQEFPFISRNFRGTPDSSFMKRGPGGGAPGRGRHPGGGGRLPRPPPGGPPPGGPPPPPRR